MKKITYSLEQFRIAQYLGVWSLYVIPVSIIIGLIVAFFLWVLEWATNVRQTHLWIIYLLPLAGILITYVYRQYGKNSDAGNNLIMDEIHEPGGGIPVRMAPLVLISTVVTHLFGGSAGREGTAVQIGGSVSSFFSNIFNFKQEDRRILLMCGMAAGFGAVFGTPVAGCIFALEVLSVGRIKYDALIPCLIAATIGHFTCISTGVHHTHYVIAYQSGKVFLFPYLSFDFLLLIKVIGAGVCFGLTGFLFAELSHLLKSMFNNYIRITWLIPVVGGALVVGISLLIGSFDYLGLGVTSANPGGISIVSAFQVGGATNLSWFWKLLLTAITLSSGFKGGEVTPLFFIGATLGNMIAHFTGAPVDLMAGLGFIAVFAGATNTPLACTFMGIELFGGAYSLYFAIACFTAYYFSGHSGIYHAQRVAISKFHEENDEPKTLKEFKSHLYDQKD
ncbi:MAG: voltage-gated chloride channel family protein [Bacteroidetes bacterium]|nr:voltage-gated chloride channel family protein [Bacteroidota bacterium]